MPTATLEMENTTMTDSPTWGVAAAYLAARTAAVRRDAETIQLGVQPKSRCETTPNPNPDTTIPTPGLDEMAKAFEFLAQGSFRHGTIIRRLSEPVTWIRQNELDQTGADVFLVSIELSSANCDWAVHAFHGFFADDLIAREKLIQPCLSPVRHPKVVKAPEWLLQRMEALRRLPAPTLEEVETSFRAAEEMRWRQESNRSNSANGRKKTVV
ncbi:MAG: hypothetical protein AB1813_18235 [Verrucomicrobiota bacterium]